MLQQKYEAWRPDRWKKRYVTLAKKPSGAARSQKSNKNNQAAYIVDSRNLTI
jgi:hypothetical protein